MGQLYHGIKKWQRKVVSDHAAAECDFTFIKTEDFAENTQELSVTKPAAKNFIHKIMWILKAFFKILSDIDNLPELLKDLG